MYGEAPESDDDDDRELVCQDWRHNAALAVHLSGLPWPPQHCEVFDVAAFAAQLDATAEDWEADPAACFAPSCPDERRRWLIRKLLR